MAQMKKDQIWKTFYNDYNTIDLNSSDLSSLDEYHYLSCKNIKFESCKEACDSHEHVIESKNEKLTESKDQYDYVKNEKYDGNY